MDMKVLRYGILAGFVGSRFGSHSSVVGFDHIYLGKPIKQNYTFMHFQIYLLAQTFVRIFSPESLCIGVFNLPKRSSAFSVIWIQPLFLLIITLTSSTLSRNHSGLWTKLKCGRQFIYKSKLNLRQSSLLLLTHLLSPRNY